MDKAIIKYYVSHVADTAKDFVFNAPEKISEKKAKVEETKAKIEGFKTDKLPRIKEIVEEDKKHYLTSRWFWTKDSKGLGDYYSPNHRSFNRREWKGYGDTAYDFMRWLKLYGFLIKSVGPYVPYAIAAMFRYAWMPSLLSVTQFMDRHKLGYRGKDLRYVEESFYSMIMPSIDCLVDILQRDSNLHPFSIRASKLRDKTLMFDEMTPVSVMMGFPDIDWVDVVGLGLAIGSEMEQFIMMYYIDAAERLGLPPEVCPYPSADIGACIVDDIPRCGKAFYGTSMPCDGSLVATMFQMRHMEDTPMYVITPAQRYNEPDANDYSVKDLKNSIKWIENMYDTKWDWNHFWKMAEMYNLTTECMIEKWNVNMTPYPQVCNAALAVQRECEYQIFGCMNEGMTNSDVKITKMMLKGYEEDKKNDYRPYRYKAIVWGCPSHYHSHFTTWAELTWGIKVCNDMESMLSYHMYHIGDKEAALYDIAHSYERMMMRSHSNGGYINWVDECWKMCEKFDIDLIINYDHITCHNGGGLTGLMDDGARDRGLNMIWVPHDLMEPRSVSRKTMREHLNRYMYNVYGDEPIDASYADFEDGKSF